MSAVLYPPARAQDVGQVLDSAFRIFQASLLKCLPYGVAAMIVAQVANIYHLAIGRPLRSFGGGDPVWWVLYLLGIVASIVFMSAMLLRQWRLVAATPTNWRAELGETLRRLPALLLMGAVVLGLVAGGLVLLLVPGLYLMVALAPAPYIVLLEGSPALVSIAKSLKLMRGNFWHASLILTVAFVVALVFYIAAFALLAILLPLLGTTDVAVVTAISVVLVVALGAIGAPFYTAVMLALYGDVQRRQASRRASD